jgi:imidazolonepropionase-like amidohydrolase
VANLKRSCRALGVLFLPLACLVACVSRSPTLLVQDVNVVDVLGDTIRSGVDVRIDGQRISAIGEGLPVPSGATVVAADGAFVIPGLWDMHVHLAAADTTPGKPEAFVSYGVTGVRDIESGSRFGPHIVYAGPTLNGDSAGSWHRVVADSAAAVHVVRQLRGEGVDFLKVHNALEPHVFFVLMREARRVGLDVAGHVPHGVTTREASDSGLRSIEHAEVLLEAEIHSRDDPAPTMGAAVARLDGENPALFEALARHGTALTPTLAAYRTFVEDQPDSARRAAADAVYSRLARIVATAHMHGVLILAGTDQPADPASVHRELRLLVEAGLTPLEALRAATSEPASFLGLADRGAVSVGNVADLVLLEADPLDDIRNTVRIVGVVRAGRYLERAELDQMRSGGEP